MERHLGIRGRRFDDLGLFGRGGIITGILNMKRSSCASGSGYVPSCSIGFCVARTKNGCASWYGLPPTVTCCSCMACEQRGLRLGRGAVDFVGEDDVGEDRALDETELAPAGRLVFLDDLGAR